MKEYLTPKEAAPLINVSLRTLELWRSNHYGPRYIKVGRKILYSRAVIDQWLMDKSYGSTSEYPDGPHSMGWTISGPNPQSWR
jgi:excisionase family DNA binding protein